MSAMPNASSGRHAVIDAGRRSRLDLGNRGSCGVLGTLHIVVGLKIQPKLMRGAEEARQAQRRIRADAQIFMVGGTGIEPVTPAV